MYTIFVENYFDRINKTYRKILSISPKPTGTITTIIKQILPERLSTHSERPTSCIYVFKSLVNSADLMSLDEIPNLFCYLTENNYTIDTGITSMMNESGIRIDGKTLLCFIKSN